MLVKSPFGKPAPSFPEIREKLQQLNPNWYAQHKKLLAAERAYEDTSEPLLIDVGDNYDPVPFDYAIFYEYSELSEKYDVLSPFARQVAALVTELIATMERQQISQIYRDGLMQVLDAPEFAEGDNVRRIVQVFEEQSVLEQVVDQYGDTDDIHVVISGDGRFAELRDISLVLARYGVSDRATGLLGVMGPRRMLYGRTIGSVRFVAALMSEMVEEIYSP